MDLTNKEDLGVLLRMHGIRLDKNLGQHYLTSKKVLQDIIESAELSEDDTVLEVGPGAGVLTVELAEKAGQVVTVELDSRAVPVLKSTLAGRENVEIRNEDALRTELPKSEWKWVANVPYQITAPLFKNYIAQENPPALAVLLVQKEVAEKVCAKEGKQNRLSLLVQNWMECELLCVVNREAFFPPPKVTSAVIKLTKKPEPKISLREWGKVERMIKIGFSQKRKKIKKALGALYPNAEDLLEQAGINPDNRAENLDLEDWKKLTETIEGLT